MRVSPENDSNSVSVCDYGTVIAIHIHGEFSLNTVETIQAAIEGALKKKIRALAISFANTVNIDSSGIGILVQYQKRLKQLGIHFVCIELNTEFVKMFEAAKLDLIFSIMNRGEFESTYLETEGGCASPLEQPLSPG